MRDAFHITRQVHLVTRVQYNTLSLRPGTASFRLEPLVCGLDGHNGWSTHIVIGENLAQAPTKAAEPCIVAVISTSIFVCPRRDIGAYDEDPIIKGRFARSYTGEVLCPGPTVLRLKALV